MSNPIHKSKNCRHFLLYVLICNSFGHLQLIETVIHHRVYTMHVQPYTICMRVNLWWHDCCISSKVLSLSFIQNHTVERMWPEVNNRVNYPLKTALVGMTNAETLDMEDSISKYCVSKVTCQLAHIGIIRMVASWNAHRIPGKEKDAQYFHTQQKMTLFLSQWMPQKNASAIFSLFGGIF